MTRALQRMIEWPHLWLVCLAILVAIVASGCATLQTPKPIGEPSPLACYGAKRTREAWEEVVREYVNQMMAAQEAYSCQSVPLTPLAPTQ